MPARCARARLSCTTARTSWATHSPRCPCSPASSPSRAFPLRHQIPARASDRGTGEDRRASETPRRVGDTPRGLGTASAGAQAAGGYRPDSSYSQPRDLASDSDDKRGGRNSMPVPSLGLGASSNSSPRISKVPCTWVRACGFCVRESISWSALTVF